MQCFAECRQSVGMWPQTKLVLAVLVWMRFYCRLYIKIFSQLAQRGQLCMYIFVICISFICFLLHFPQAHHFAYCNVDVYWSTSFYFCLFVCLSSAKFSSKVYECTECALQQMHMTTCALFTYLFKLIQPRPIFLFVVRVFWSDLLLQNDAFEALFICCRGPYAAFQFLWGMTLFKIYNRQYFMVGTVCENVVLSIVQSNWIRSYARKDSQRNWIFFSFIQH